jgi:DNA polymerase-3 subunit gamma/tau
MPAIAPFDEGIPDDADAPPEDDEPPFDPGPGPEPEAVVRQVLRATFLREEPFETATRFH